MIIHLPRGLRTTAGTGPPRRRRGRVITAGICRGDITAYSCTVTAVAAPTSGGAAAEKDRARALKTIMTGHMRQACRVVIADEDYMSPPDGWAD